MKKYGIIYADPPWEYKVYSDKGKGKSAERHYPTMTLKEICALPVGELAEQDCVLLMWTTIPVLRDAFSVISNWIENADFSATPVNYAMAAYKLNNTLTENGTVSRGVCTVSDDNFLTDVVERTKILRKEDGKIYFTEDEETWEELPEDVNVSMNCWCFPASFIDAAVQVAGLWGGIYSKMRERFFERNRFCLMKVQDGVIQVDEQKFKHGSFSY